MIKKFNEYVTDVYESHHTYATYKNCIKYEVDGAPTKSTDQIFDEFKKEGFKYVGRFEWATKTINNWVDENVELFIEKYFRPLEKEILGEEELKFEAVDVYFGCSKYFSLSPNKHKTLGEDEKYDKDTQELIDKYGEQMTINIIKKRQRILKDFITSTGEHAINMENGGVCLYNPEKKYFYFMYLMRDRYISNYKKIFELWIRLKTSTTDEVKKYLTKIKEDKIEAERVREERRRQYMEKKRIQQEQDEKKKKALETVNDYQNKIKNDVEKNENKYKKTDWNHLPANIRKQLNETDVEKQAENEYFRYTRSEENGRLHGPREDEEVTCFINNRDLTDGYQYKSLISHYSTSYWGD